VGSENGKLLFREPYESQSEECCPAYNQASLNQFRKYIFPFFSFHIPEALLTIEQSGPFLRRVVRLQYRTCLIGLFGTFSDIKDGLGELQPSVYF
jgi:hypothetical protein